MAANNVVVVPVPGLALIRDQRADRVSTGQLMMISKG